MGRKISNRLYSSFRNCFGLIFSGLLGRRPESLTWDFREWEILVTLFISIFVCFTPPLIFLEPLKLASWNFHTACTDDGANSVLSHRWLAPIGANGGGSKYVVNFGIFKNHSGGPRGSQISTGRFQIHTYGGGGPLRIYCRLIILGNSHNRFHFRFPAKIRGAISPQPMGISTSNLQDM